MKLGLHTSVELKRAGSRGVPAVYVVRHYGKVVGRFTTRAAAYRCAREYSSKGQPLPVTAQQQQFSIGLFAKVKVS